MTYWQQFAGDPDSNTSPPPVGAPEGNYRGSWVNNTFRFVMAACRELGDTTLKIVSGEGSPFTPSSVAGSLALQNSNAIDITGGYMNNVYGSIPIGACIPFSGSSTSATLTEAEALLATHGLALCDGRQIGGWTTPDLRGLFLQGWLPWAAPGTKAGDTTMFTTTTTTTTNGAHSHGGATLLAGAHDHNGSTTGALFTDIGSSMIRSVTDGVAVQHRHPIPADGGHTHPIFEDGAHTHTVDTTPPTYRVVWLQRVPV